MDEPKSRISGLFVQVEIQVLDGDGDEINRYFLTNDKGIPATLPLFMADIKKVPGLLDLLASKGVKVV